jgi:hypothetical protein
VRVGLYSKNRTDHRDNYHYRGAEGLFRKGHMVLKSDRYVEAGGDLHLMEVLRFMNHFCLK